VIDEANIVKKTLRGIQKNDPENLDAATAFDVQDEDP